MDADLEALLSADHKPAKGKLKKSMRKPNNVITFMPTYNREWEAISFAKGEYNARELDEVEYISAQFRAGGAVALAVEVGEGACSVDDLRAFVAEQATAKGQFPGPCPVLMSGEVSEALHVAEAKRCGCLGVIVDVDKVGKDKAAELLEVAATLGLESVAAVGVGSMDGDAKDLLAGCDVVMAVADKVADVVDATAKFPEGVCKLAACDVGEVREAWELRDNGLNCCVLGNKLLVQSTVERVEIQSMLKAMKAKGSTKYGRGTSMGRGEGAKEILGTIAV